MYIYPRREKSYFMFLIVETRKKRENLFIQRDDPESQIISITHDTQFLNSIPISQNLPNGSYLTNRH